MSADDQSLFAFLEETKFQILKLEKCEIFQPSKDWTKQTDVRTRALKAIELKKGKHLEFKPIGEFGDCKEDFVNFLGSKIKGTEGNIRYDIISEVFRCNLEMMESSNVSASMYTEETEDPSEAEVRFTTIDPIVKSIARATQTVVASEVSVLSTDSQVTSGILPRQQTLQDAPTGQTQGDVSRNYTFYSLAQGRSMKYVCGLVEVKKSAFFNDNAVCQTIGYYIAARSGAAIQLSAQHPGPTPPATPLAILFCEDKLRFIFFPFISDKSTPCVDAVVTQPIAMMDERNERSIDMYWFAFVCLYLKDILTSTSSVFLASSKYDIKPHEKQVYSEILETPYRTRIEETAGGKRRTGAIAATKT